ncbi:MULTISPECIES: Abi family protein [unclassified Arthrobacter]|uniref:Abi family protein n=1 Tax=unclassified Arthrobacter TaxID=235627 RepID=UPI001C6168B0|nr:MULTISPECIES: Abi family protein [unclassified Arthrobacter]
MAKASGNDTWIENWLSMDRFSTYLEVAGGSRTRALDLYDWNAKLSAAFLHDLSHLEVGLRNACDRQLAAATLPGDTHWTDPATLLALFPIVMRRNKLTGRLHDVNKIPRSNVERARTSAATKPHAPPLPGKTVAEIMFGFWTYLLADAHEKTIWVPHLHKAFPPGTDRNRLNDSLASLRRFRNRVAHHENILRGSEGERRRIVYLVRLLSTDVLEHLQANSDVATILGTRP